MQYLNLISYPMAHFFQSYMCYSWRVNEADVVGRTKNCTEQLLSQMFVHVDTSIL